MAQPVVPCALEFMDGNAIEMVRPEVGDSLPEGAGALLMIEVDGIASQLDELVECVVRAAGVDGALGVEAARSSEEVAALWSIRKALSPALRRVAPKKINEDVVVPVSRIPELVTELEQLATRHRIRIVNFGHAGNGNLHVNLMFDPSDASQQARATACLEDVFAAVLRMQGTISGEHGIGVVKREWVGRELDATSLELMRAIKAQFDPDGILNPGKAFPADTGTPDRDTPNPA
jgi:D-lactate dehydrogenase